MAKQLLFSLLIFSTALHGQQDSLSKSFLPTSHLIATARQELLIAFLADDPAGASVWRDSLMRLEDSSHTALVWDERWLLYYWEESYGNLFDEVARFDGAGWEQLASKVPPKKDSLFEHLDKVLYERRFQIYESISRGFLSEEEKQFAFIELDYLLRLNQKEQASGEWNKRLNNFLNLHPDSRFKSYIKSNLYTPTASAKKVKTDRGGSIDILFSSGRWRNELERNVRSPYGFEIGLSYLMKRWNFGLRSNFSWQKLNRSVFQDGYEWPKNDPTVLIMPSLEVGYSIINSHKFRLFPAVGAGISILKPPSPDEEEDNPPPDYYSDFNFTKGFLGVLLNADIKLKTFESNDTNYPSASYIGVRLRIGYNWLNWGDQNPDLRGDMFFFAAGINLSGQSLE